MSRTSVKSRTASRLPTLMTGAALPASIVATCLAKFEVTEDLAAARAGMVEAARPDRADPVAHEVLIGEKILRHLGDRIG